MNKNTMKAFKHPFLILLSVALASCTLPSMIKMAKEQALTVDPSPLEVHNGLVEYNLSANLPVKMLKKGTIYTINSYYKHGENELPLAPVVFKAEDYPGSDTKQPSVSKPFSFPYKAEYAQGVLEVEGVASKGEKTKTTPRMQIATGLITTSMWVQNAYYVAYADHGYNDKEEIIPVVIPDFIFNQGRSNLLRSELKSDKGKQLDAFIASKNITKNVIITGTHSPEGTQETNKKLSEERAAAIKKYYRKKMDKFDYKDMAKSIQFTLKPVFENWNELKAMLSTYKGISSEEKQAYNSIINNGKSFPEQEKEMEKLPSYKKVFKELYPSLRTAKTKILTIKKKKTPEEIFILAKQVIANQITPDTLSFEEFMYAGAATPSLQEKEAIYTAASKKKTAASAHNNLGAVYLSTVIANSNTQPDILKKASVQFDLAIKIEALPETNANLATLSLIQGNPQKALEFAEKALYQSKGDLAKGVNGVKGAAEIYLAKYSDATRSESVALRNAINTFNQGLAFLLTKDYSGATNALNESIKQNNEFAPAYYVMALNSARTDDIEGVTQNLRKAVELAPDLKSKALVDLEFAKYFNTDSFREVLK